jgi:hypothetical protein
MPVLHNTLLFKTAARLSQFRLVRADWIKPEFDPSTCPAVFSWSCQRLQASKPEGSTCGPLCLAAVAWHPLPGKLLFASPVVARRCLKPVVRAPFRLFFKPLIRINQTVRMSQSGAKPTQRTTAKFTKAYNSTIFQ